MTGLSACGSVVPHRFAPSALMAMRARHSAPAASVGLRRRKRAAFGWNRCGARASADSMSTAPGPPTRSVPDAGIEDDIGQIDDEVEEHVDARDDEDDALNDGIVTAHDRVHGEPAETGHGEDALRHHRAADQEREADADDGHHRQ